MKTLSSDERQRDKGNERSAWSLLTLATGTTQRARGLLFTTPRDEALLLVPCGDIHTIGIRHNLDVAFVDRTGRVLEAHRAVGPLRRLRNRKAVAVIERFATCKPWFQAGDRIGLGCMRMAETESEAPQSVSALPSVPSLRKEEKEPCKRTESKREPLHAATILSFKNASKAANVRKGHHL